MEKPKIAAKIEIAATTKTTVLIMAETMTKRKDERMPAPTRKAINLFNEPSNTDVNGSYTGRPKNKRELPVQDADDL